MPVDRTVTEGNFLVDESMLTGESMPIEKKPSDTVAINALMLKRTKLPGIGVYDESQPVLRAVEATA
jgi:P-type Cu+ transporter